MKLKFNYIIFITIGFFLTCSNYLNNDLNRADGNNLVMLDKIESDSVNLKSLTVSSGVLEPSFNPSVNEYTLAVDSELIELDINLITEDEKAIIEIDNEIFNHECNCKFQNLQLGVQTKIISIFSQNIGTKEIKIIIYKNSYTWDSDCIVNEINTAELHYRKSINGKLDISNTELSDLNCLSNLEEVKGDLIIKHNKSLKDISGLDSIKNLNGNIIVEDNPNIINIGFLDRIKNINGNLEIISNENLYKICINQSNIEIIKGNLIVLNNTSLLSFGNMSSIVEISGKLDIENNSSLIDLKALKNVTKIGDDFFIINNASLLFLGLDNCIEIFGDTLVFSENEKLIQLYIEGFIDNLRETPNIVIIE